MATTRSTMSESNPQPESGTTNVGAKIDDLMKKSRADAPAPPKPKPAAAAKKKSIAAAGTDAIADGPAEMDDALEDLLGAFDAVQDVVSELDSAPATAPPKSDDVAPADDAEVKQAVGPATDAADPEQDETEAERQQRDEELTAQLQAMLDEASADEHASFVSPEDVLKENQGEQPEENAPAQGPAEPVAEAETQAPPAPEAAEAADAEEAPLIEQIDTLLADHAEDAISGEFESVDTILGVDTPPGENVADPADDLDPEDAADEPEADALGGDFQSLDDLMVKPDEAQEDDPDQDEADDEDDDLDGLFQAPEAVDESTPAHTPEPAPEVSEAPAEEDEQQTQDDEIEGGFESLDTMLDAPPPTEDQRDGTPAPAATETAAATAEPQPPTQPAQNGGWEIKINLAVLRAAAALLLGWMLWSCAVVNKPLDRLPETVQQTVGWVALAVAGPGALLVGYGLIFS